MPVLRANDMSQTLSLVDLEDFYSVSFRLKTEVLLMSANLSHPSKPLMSTVDVAERER